MGLVSGQQHLNSSVRVDGRRSICTVTFPSIEPGSRLGIAWIKDMIDIRKLKELIKLMVENELTELDLQDQQETVTIKRGPQGEPVVHHGPVVQGSAPAPTSAATDRGPTESGRDMEGIESPMVGTFYAAASPDSAPFVKVGDNISSETVVCVVEAMKVFNEIKAECGGTIDRVLVKNGDAVEFGQKLFLVKPA